MTPANDSVHHNEVERLLASLAGVVSAHVVADGQGEPIEIHVLASSELHPKQVVRNVESALSAGLGMQIDRRIVSVAQVRASGGARAQAPKASTGPTTTAGGNGSSAARGHDEDEDGGEERQPESRRRETRLEYVRFDSHRNAEQCTCDVVLRDGPTQYTGSGAGPDTAGGRAEAAARGVLDAIEQARPGVKIDLQGATISSSRGRSYVIVSASAILRRETVALAGAAPMARSPEEAGILATLQATNRWSA